MNGITINGVLAKASKLRERLAMLQLNQKGKSRNYSQGGRGIGKTDRSNRFQSKLQSSNIMQHLNNLGIKILNSDSPV